MKRAFAGVLMLCAAGAFAEEVFPPPCDPTPVRKTVKAVRREILVTIVGEARPSLPKGREPTLEECVGYWTRAMDREIVRKPDLVVLPEGVDSWDGATPADKLRWVRRRGDRLLKAFQSYARAHRCYLVFNSYRQRSDGRFANCTYALDREGDVVGVYDKVCPTPGEIGWKELPIVPGKGPVVIETDFGRMGFVTCFDLNFRDLLEAYRREKPDVLCFCSAYHGGFWQQVWSNTCRSYLVAATLGPRSKDVWGPSGEEIFRSTDYFRTCSVKVNTNFRVAHLDDNWVPLRKVVEKYGRKVEVRNPGSVGCVTVLSTDPDLPVDRIIEEFGIVLWDDYYDKSVQLRGGPLQ